MSTISTDLRIPAMTRTSASRAADGVMAGYIRSLAQAAAKPAAQVMAKRDDRRVADAYGCGASRTSGLAARRRPSLRRVPSPA